ncbi:hemicentin-1 isoform X2 [Takifugu flavidus]|uniref:hemicentin-1 isoform X2 n=1 Tax=Takifugu flavidus TaxID=433684 RepID=UPI0025446863|nr:hemicentin-1 isoform X2 [Takifugu flavidus]
MWLREVFGVFYLTAVFATTDAQNDLPKPVLKVTQGWADAFENEIMEFLCEVDTEIPDVTFTWYKDKKELQEDTDIYSEESYLNITSVERVHEGGYTCQIQLETTKSEFSNTISVTVYENVPKATLKKDSDLNPMYVGETVNFTCNVGVATGWQYQWHKDGMALNETDKTYSMDLQPSAAGRYSCLASRGSMTSTEMSGEIKQDVANIPVPSLRNLVPWQDVFPGERVQMSCHMNDSADWTYTWYKDGQEVHTGLGVSFDSNKATLFISSAAATSRGEYKCTGHLINRSVSTGSSSGFNLEVYENKPQPLMTQQPDVEKVYIGEPVSFKCEIKDSAGWEYVWFKDGKELPLNTNVLDIPHASVSDSGTYECKGIRNKTKYNSKNSHRRQVLISEIPSPKVENITQWLHVFPTESLRLSCEMDGSSDWMFSWHKDGQEVHAGQDVSFDKDATVLSINSASASHRGRYSCSGKHKQRTVSSNVSSGIQLDVYDTKPRVQLSQSPEHTLMHTEDSVTFLCHINISTGWEFLWFKDDRPLTVPGNNLTLSSMSVKNTGLYKCQTRRGTSLIFSSDPSPTIYLTVEERPKAEVILLTGWSQVFSTDSLLLSCRLQNSQERWNYTWYRDGRKLENPPSPTYRVTPQDDPEQSQYSCQGIRNGTLSYSRISDQFWTKNLLLKRRLLLSIAGCIVFGICIICIGCIVLRMCRKKAQEDYKPEEADLFLRMDALKDSDDGPPLLVQYVTESALNSLSKEEGENGTVISESPLPPVQEEPATTTESSEAMQNNNSGLISFMQ